MSRRRSQVIELRLNQAEEMFALAQTDLFSEYRNYLTGVEYCISVLRSQRVPGTVRLQLSLPPGQLDDALGERLRLALRRYCDQRISYNARERRAVRWGGVRSLWVGVPIVVIGYLLVIFEDHRLGAGVGGHLVPARHRLLQPARVRAGDTRARPPARRRDHGDHLAADDELTCPSAGWMISVRRRQAVDDGLGDG
jgi:hypothetical protein